MRSAPMASTGRVDAYKLGATEKRDGGKANLKQNSVQNLEQEIRVFKYSNILSHSLARFWRSILTDGKSVIEAFNLSGLYLICSTWKSEQFRREALPKEERRWRSTKVFSRGRHHSWWRFCDWKGQYEHPRGWGPIFPKEGRAM
jgi:hypothetical protein